MGKHETILSVDESTKEVMDCINQEICDAIGGSLENNLKGVLKPVKADIEELAEKIQMDLKETGKKVEKISSDSEGRIETIRQELRESQEKAAAKTAEFAEKMLLDLKEVGKKVEKISSDSEGWIEATRKELRESHEKATTKIEETVKMVEKVEKTIQQILNNQLTMFEKVDKLQEDVSYLKQPFLKLIFNKGKL
jgi:hypothetical protein